jgi:hypothetical protein
MAAADKKATSGDLGFEAELFKAADKLRGNMEPSDYKTLRSACCSLSTSLMPWRPDTTPSLAKIRKQLRIKMSTSPRTYFGFPRRLAGRISKPTPSFAEKMTRLTAQLSEQMAKGAELDALIKAKLGALVYEI